MLIVKAWTTEDFLDKEKFQALQETAREFLLTDDEQEAHLLYKDLNQKWQTISGFEDKNRVNDYEQLLLTLKLIALPRLEDEEVIECTRKEIGFALEFDQEELNIKNKIRRKLANMPLVSRDGYKERLIKALEENEQVFIESNIEVSGAKTRGTIANWLKDYRLFNLDGKIDEKLAKAEYLFRSRNVLMLDNKERAKLKTLLDLYDDWHISSYTLAGYEDPLLFEDDGKLYGVYQGEIFSLDEGTPTRESDGNLGLAGKKAVTDLKNIKVEPVLSREETVTVEDKEKIESKLNEAYHNFISGDLWRGILSAKDKLHGENGEVKIWRNHFYQAVNGGKKDEAVAVLLLAAEDGKLNEFFGSDQRFINFWGAYLVKNNLGKELFDNDPANAKDMARFLQYILEKRLGINSQEAAMIGVMVANAARGAGETEDKILAYGDLERGEVRWNT